MEQHEKIIEEIDEVLGVSRTEIPFDKATNAGEYAKVSGITRATASGVLRKGWIDGKLERGRDNQNVLWYWKK